MTKALGFLQSADEIRLLDAPSSQDALVTLYVHAGIAAADVICCVRLGRHSSGDNHAEAIGMLRRADAAAAPKLGVLLAMKTKAGYSHTPATAADTKKAARAATHLVDVARALDTG